MNYFYLVVLVMSIGLWVLALAWRWDFGKISAWQFHRARQRSNAADQLLLRRWRLYPMLRTIVLISSGMLASWCWVLIFQLQANVWWAIGYWLAIWVAVLTLARFKVVAKISERLYLRIEPQILPRIEKIADWNLPLLRQPDLQDSHLSSRQEFDYLIERDQKILTVTERQIIQSVTDFVSQRAIDLMIPLEKLTSVKSTELLGPLKINELYQTGERLFVVTTKTGVAGLIKLDDLTNLDSGESYQARQLARRDFLEVATDADLIEVLSRLIEQDTQVALVGDSRQILGIIKLETILKQLKIINL